MFESQTFLAFFEPLKEFRVFLNLRGIHKCLKLSPEPIKSKFWSEFPRGYWPVCYCAFDQFSLIFTVIEDWVLDLK